MSGPCLSSSVAGRPLRPATRHSLGEPLPHQLADRPRAHPKASDCSDFNIKESPLLVTYGINPPFGGLSRSFGQVAHVLLTLAPLNSICIATSTAPFDLHVLSTPPAFVLSQNQTLQKESLYTRGANRMCVPTIFCYCLFSTAALSSDSFIDLAVCTLRSHLVLAVSRDS